MDILSNLRPDNQFVETFEDERNSLWSPLDPTDFPNPQVAIYSAHALKELGIPTEHTSSEEFSQIFSGSHPELSHYATCYGGHQFGNWAGQLGDGRAMHIGEFINSNQTRWDLQLKGSGPTPYSRRADGKAVLRSSIREFLCSEAMEFLGVPTTRALCLLRTGESVLRDKLYDGHPAEEPGAVVCRMASSFLRFGHFEILAARGQKATLKKMIQFSIERDFPHLVGTEKPENTWFQEICTRTAVLMAHWQRVGFVHGVMNTDNMSISGLTIDYGPYGWVEPYDTKHTPNTTDLPGRRYAFGQQPEVGLWNLGCLANALATISEDHSPLYAGLEAYRDRFAQESATMTSAKFGFRKPQDQTLFQTCFDLMEESVCDHTIFFRKLAIPSAQLCTESIESAFYKPLSSEHRTRWETWLADYKHVIAGQRLEEESRITHMNSTNPCYILRNSLVHKAILQSEAGDDTELKNLLKVIEAPYTENPQYTNYQQKRPQWAEQEFGCSMLSCSS